ncbi:MAG: hypothetical protein RLZ98_2639, partial [Pseudomonadota bacterium]
MKVCIFGAGVIGGILGSAIARAGHEVALIARGPHLEAIKSRGLVLNTPNERYTTKHVASDDPADFGTQDLVIVATKTPALPQVARTIAPLVGTDTLVAFAVNGTFWFYGDGFTLPDGRPPDTMRLDPDGALHAVVGAERAVGIVCKASGDIKTPGTIEMTRPRGSFTAGPALAKNFERVRDMFDELAPPMLDIEVVQDIRTPMWAKHVAAVGNMAVGALTGASTMELQAVDALQALRLTLMAEADAIAKAHGFADTGFDYEKEWPMRS